MVVIKTMTLVSLAWAQNDGPPNAELLTKENIVDTARPNTAWWPASVGQRLLGGDRLRTGALSRATLRLTDLSVLRVNELTTLQILLPDKNQKPGLDLGTGAVYFFSREKPREMRIRTPIATGALRGTEFHLAVGANGRTVLDMLDGEVELQNALGSIVVRSGERGTVEPGRAPYKTAMIEAVNIIQWCLYYPGVLDLAELHLQPNENTALSASLTAYQQGDLLAALATYPKNHRTDSVGARVYHAALLLCVGQVNQAKAELAKGLADAPGAEALQELIAAVKLETFQRQTPPETASDWMAESYYQQSRRNLAAARAAAHQATELDAEFGFAWTRLAEMEFSFGRTLWAMKVLERGLELAPRQAEAHALQGFVLSAENRMGAARRSFDDAITLDGALANAWLGRGLTYLRQGAEQEGRRDLQTAAVLEPNRSVLRSYLGKAFSQVGNNEKADLELNRAIQLDPADPTPWLYSAIQNKQENRYNEAIGDLEKSIALNDNRGVFRSHFLLDQDRAIRGTNLAAIYQNNGMTEQSIREAVRAVDSDYASAPAHLFLANSYNALRDPNRVALRYETASFNELLLSNLLSPVGGGPLSQFVSEQEYSKLFQKDGLGVSNVTEYTSLGDLRTTASQYGTFGNISYALDGEYVYSNGVRPNNRFSGENLFATFKFQLSPQDTLLFQSAGSDTETGDVLQRYDPRDAETLLMNGIRIPNRAALTSHMEEDQKPGLLLLGWDHQWSPGNHTLLLVGRLASDQTVTAEDTFQRTVTRDVTEVAPSEDPNAPLNDRAERFAPLRRFAGQGTIRDITTDALFDSDYRSRLTVYTVDLQHIAQFGPETLIFGGRYQHGEIETGARLTDFDNGTNPFESELFEHNPPLNQHEEVSLERINGYIYNLLRLTSWLSITGGLSYDSLHYPDNFRNPPLNERQAALDKLSPKVGFILQPWWGLTFRGAYAEAISGTSFDESVRLEPTQVSGFLQAYRSLISESIVGSVAGSKYRIAGLSLEQKLPTLTYLGVEFQELHQDVNQTIGVFDKLTITGSPVATFPSSLTEEERYREDTFLATLNQLVGANWALGAIYRYTQSNLRQRLPELAKSAPDPRDFAALNRLVQQKEDQIMAGLHELHLYLLYNHPSGFFSRLEANWYQQESDSLSSSITQTERDAQGVVHARIKSKNNGLPEDSFWQFNFLAGYRFYRNQCELSCGVLNFTGADYRLNPLNPYNELPREPTIFARCKLDF